MISNFILFFLKIETSKKEGSNRLSSYGFVKLTSTGHVNILPVEFVAENRGKMTHFGPESQIRKG